MAKAKAKKNDAAFDKIRKKYDWKIKQSDDKSPEEDFGARLGRDILKSLKDQLVLPTLKIG